MKHFLTILAVLAVMVCSAFAQGRQGVAVSDVRVKRVGAGVVDEGFVFAHISAKAGRTLDPGEITADVKRLLATGKFTDVRVEVENAGDQSVLIYNVQGRLVLGSPVNVKGAKYLSVSKIRDLLTVVAGDLVDEAMLVAHGQKVLNEYRDNNYVDADLTWSIKVVDAKEGRVQADLVVKEGTRASIRSINVTGNKRMPTGILEDAAGKKAWWNVWEWFSAGKFDKDELQVAKTSVRTTCVSRGYLDAEVGEPEMVRRKNGSYDVSFRVKEGLLYKVRAVTVKGATLFPELELTRLIGIRKNSPILMEEISMTADTIRKYYTDRGYTRTTVKTAFDTIRADKLGEGWVDISFTVTEGDLMHVRNIFIRGNAQTKEKVIRRELVIQPGDILAERNLVYSENRLRNLGYFSRVVSHPEVTPALNEADLIFEVEEQRTGAFMVGGGFSSVDNIVGYFEISEGNFDVGAWPPKGAGQKLRLHGQVGSRTTQADISFTEPWFLDRRITLGLDMFATEVDYDEYKKKSVGGALTLGWPMKFLFGRCETRYSIEKVEVNDISDTNEYTRISGDLAGDPYFFTSTNVIKSSLSVLLTSDTRDDFFTPSRGRRISVKGYIAGSFLGGDEDIYGWEVRGEQHISPWANHVISLKGRAEVVNEYGGDTGIPISDLLFAGGAGWARGIRGFEYRDVGPKVTRTVPSTDIVQYRPIGGRTLAIGTVEYAIPLVEKLKLVLFADAGNVWENAYDFQFQSMAASAGVELRLDYRQFPIRVNYSWVIQKDDEHTNEHPWGFSLGSGF
ncbi:MAG: outer membrane protein assembly factor BamA [bacterium]